MSIFNYFNFFGEGGGELMNDKNIICIKVGSESPVKPTLLKSLRVPLQAKGKKHHHYLKHNRVSICRKYSLSNLKFHIQLSHFRSNLFTYFHVCNGIQTLQLFQECIFSPICKCTAFNPRAELS